MREFCSVAKMGRGRLFVMPKPEPARLAAEAAALTARGVGQIVCLLESGGVARERRICERAGWRFRHFPIPVFSIPPVPEFDAFIEDLYGDITAGRGAAVHCLAGIGRTGMVASALLIRHGRPPADAVDRVSRARGYRIPDTDEQYRFILAYGARRIT